MLERIPDRNIWVIYGAILLLGIAYGTSIAVLAIHLDAHGIPKLAMGWLAAAFAIGIIGFSIPAGLVVSRFGAKTTLLCSLVGYALSVAAFPFLTTLAGLSVARFFDGAFSVGIWVSAETALLQRARTNKAFVMSVYAVSLAVGYVVGPFLAKLVVAIGNTSWNFVVAGILACVAAVVVFTRLDHDDGKAEAEEAAAAGARSDTLTILWRVKTSCFATFSYGYFQASVVLFLPLYLIEAKSIPKENTILITAFFALGMLSMAMWMAKIGDKHGHLLVMRCLAAVGGAMVASFVLLDSFVLMCGAVFVAGATLAAISPVSLALQGVVTPRQDLGRANAFYNAAYAAGMLIGPPLSSFLFTRMGGATMLYHLAGLWALFVAFTIVFASDDPRARGVAVAAGATAPAPETKTETETPLLR